jgi:hypothetical protein
MPGHRLVVAMQLRDEGVGGRRISMRGKRSSEAGAAHTVAAAG